MYNGHAAPDNYCHHQDSPTGGGGSLGVNDSCDQENCTSDSYEEAQRSLATKIVNDSNTEKVRDEFDESKQQKVQVRVTREEMAGSIENGVLQITDEPSKAHSNRCHKKVSVPKDVQDVVVTLGQRCGREEGSRWFVRTENVRLCRFLTVGNDLEWKRFLVDLKSEADEDYIYLNLNCVSKRRNNAYCILSSDKCRVGVRLF